MIEESKKTYTVKVMMPDGQELVASNMTKENSEWLESKLTAGTKTTLPVQVMPWNEMYGVLDFLNGRPIHTYAPEELMKVEILELRKTLAQLKGVTGGN